jgi:hypothetical protein
MGYFQLGVVLLTGKANFGELLFHDVR